MYYISNAVMNVYQPSIEKKRWLVFFYLKSKTIYMQWMLDIQLGRRNLSPIQRIAVTEKYRPIYEKQAKENLIIAGNNYGIGQDRKPLPNLVKAITSVDTTKKLSKLAGVSKETYRMGAKVLNSDNEKLKKEVLSGEKTISKAYKDLQNENKKVNERINRI